MIEYGVIVHGGVSSPLDRDEGCRRAAGVAFEILSRGGTALDAVEEASAVLEDDPDYNAGTGSRPRTNLVCEMDAGLMSSDGRIGIVAAIARVRNPIRVARRVMEATPHVMLAGQGAIDFARREGFDDFDPLTPERRKRALEIVEDVRSGRLEAPRSVRDCIDACDTIGVVALDSSGGFAAANSTGGIPLMLPGRVGDSPMVGAGFFASGHCAVATTGNGEEIIRNMSAIRICDRFGPDGSLGELEELCRDEVLRYPPSVTFGVIAICRDGTCSFDNRTMPVAREIRVKPAAEAGG